MEEIKPKKKALSIIISDDLLEMLETLKKDLATSTYSGVITQCINSKYYQIHPVYKQKDINDQSVEKMEKIAKNKVLMKDLEEKAKEEIRLQPFINSCLTDFKGRVEGDMCKFMVYGTEKQFDNEDEIGLESCSPEMAEARMFLPSKEAVFNKRKDVKKLYD